MSLHRACCCGGLEPWPPPGEFSCSVACSIGYFPQAWNVRLRWSLRTVYQVPIGGGNDPPRYVEEVEYDGDLQAVIQRLDPPLVGCGCEWAAGFEAPGYPQFINGSMTFAMNRFYEVLPPDPSDIRDFNTGCPSGPGQDQLPPWVFPYPPVVTPDNNRVTISLPEDDITGDEQIESVAYLFCVGFEGGALSGWRNAFTGGGYIANPFGDGVVSYTTPRINDGTIDCNRDYPFPPDFYPRPVADLKNGFLRLETFDAPNPPSPLRPSLFVPFQLPIFLRAAPQCAVEYGHASDIFELRWLGDKIADLEENGPPPVFLGGFRSIEVEASFEVTPA